MGVMTRRQEEANAREALMVENQSPSLLRNLTPGNGGFLYSVVVLFLLFGGPLTRLKKVKKSSLIVSNGLASCPLGDH